MKLRRILATAAIALAAANPVSLSFAQTTMSPPGSASASGSGPFRGADPLGTGANVHTPPTPALPPSQASVRQAADQNEGLFAPLVRTNGGQIQDVWTDTEEGITTFPLRGKSNVYKVIAREFMTTTIILPPDAEIISADLGDPAGFSVAVRTRNMIALRPNGWGMDTNLNIYTKSGLIYSFYLRAENPQSWNVPDLLVRIQGLERDYLSSGFLLAGDDAAANGDGKEKSATTLKDAPLPLTNTAAAIHDLQAPSPQNGDWVREIPFNPDELHGWDDYELWGDTELKPVRVFRDKRFTYLQYGEKWDGTELPTAYVVVVDSVDEYGVDELVNTRVQGTSFIIEATAPLISLKLGKKYLCIRYDGEE